MQPRRAGSITEPARKHHWAKIALMVAVVASITVLALVFVPARSVSRELTVTSLSPATTEFAVSGPAWVTVHFDRHGTAGMMFWMHGPSGMMFNRSMMGAGMMGGSDSYSFWSWGGDYRCGAEYSGAGSGSMPVWMNATWGFL